MKFHQLYIFLFVFICSGLRGQEPESREDLHHESVGDPHLAPSVNSRRIRPAIDASQALQHTATTITTVQVNVDGAGNNITLDAANEPSIAINPNNPDNIVIGWRQFDNVLSNFRQAGYSYSNDGGQTWAAGNKIQPGIFRSDPVLDCDSAGNFFYNSLTQDQFGNFLCDVFKSTNGGTTWDNGTPAHGGDKQWMLVDKSGNTGTNNIYSFWSSTFSSCFNNDFTRSTNAGNSYDSCEFINGDPKYGTMDMDSHGALYIGGMNSPNIPIVTKCVAPDVAAGPLTWTSHIVYLDGTNNSSASVNPAGLIGQVSIAADHTGFTDNVYIASSLERMSFVDHADAMFSKSTDGGQTWSPPVRINDDPGYYLQWITTMSVAPNGRIDVVWLDTRDNPGLDNSALYYSYSYDGGDTWSVNEKLSQTFDPHIGYPNQDKMGDYFQMISDNTSAHLAWCNTLNGEEDIYYSVITPPLPTAINESLNAAWNLYPNPAKDLMRINSNILIDRLEVYSLAGSIVKTQKIRSKSAMIDLSNLAGGFYFAKVTFTNGFVNVKRISVNK